MADEKPPETPQSGKPEAEKPAGETPAAKPAPEAPPAAKPAAPPTPGVPAPGTAPQAAKPTGAAAAHEKPAAAAPTGPAGEPWSGEVMEALRKTFPDLQLEGFTYREQHYVIVPREAVAPVMMYLKGELQFTLLADLTAVHYPKREKPFEAVYQLYSFSRNERLRVKAPLADGETIESVVPVWSGADWMEREVFDMFGIRFDNHPNLRRILLPEEWEGHPLRKDYGIIQQDQRWVQENLHIESGQ